MKKQKVLSQTPMFDQAYAWTAAGPGWSNYGISYPVRIVEKDGKVYRERIETRTIQAPRMDAFAVVVAAQRLVAIEAEKDWKRNE